MTPEAKFELLWLLLQHGVEVRTYYRGRRVVSVERVDSQVFISYEDGGVDKIHLRDLARRRFVAII